MRNLCEQTGQLHTRTFPSGFAVEYAYDTADISEPVFLPTDDDRMNKRYGRDDMTSNSVGIVFSVGIRFRISHLVAIGAYSDGMFSNANKSWADKQPATINLPRKINRVGFSMGLEFNF